MLTRMVAWLLPPDQPLTTTNVFGPAPDQLTVTPLARLTAVMLDSFVHVSIPPVPIATLAENAPTPALPDPLLNVKGPTGGTWNKGAAERVCYGVI